MGISRRSINGHIDRERAQLYREWKQRNTAVMENVSQSSWMEKLDYDPWQWMARN